MKGACYHVKDKKWKAFITKNGKEYHLGNFDTRELALSVRRRVEQGMFGKYAAPLEVNPTTWTPPPPSPPREKRVRNTKYNRLRTENPAEPTVYTSNKISDDSDVVHVPVGAGIYGATARMLVDGEYQTQQYIILDSYIYEQIADGMLGLAGGGYVYFRWQRQGEKPFRLSRLIWGEDNISPGCDIDHINRNPLDNRVCNLRVATRSQNMINTDLRSTNTSGVKGVRRVKLTDKWTASITKDYVTYGLGTYGTMEEAADARKRAESELFGEYATK